jgi:dethiobiotin synthase
MSNTKIIVTGCGTDVGKTVVSAILMLALDADYWKPIECGSSDTTTLKSLLPHHLHKIHSPAYSFSAPVSPHLAAELEQKQIVPSTFSPPGTSSPLIIEGAGGIFVPLNETTLLIDLLAAWEANWIVVSKHYVGSINHTLLTLEALQRRSLNVSGIIFNGALNPSSERAILSRTALPCLGRLFPEQALSFSTLKRYAHLWSQPLHSHLGIKQFSGTPLPIF